MRRKEFDMKDLQSYRLIHKLTCNRNKLKTADLDLLIYLNPIEYFTKPDFDNGKYIMAWDMKRFYRLQNDGWIKKVYDGRGSAQHNKYATTQKTKLMINKMGKWIDGEDLPLIPNASTYTEKTINTQVKRYNKQKYNNGRNERLYG